MTSKKKWLPQNLLTTVFTAKIKAMGNFHPVVSPLTVSVRPAEIKKESLLFQR